jgi:hypothetical protein
MYFQAKCGFFEVDRYQNTPVPAVDGVVPKNDDIIVRARKEVDLYHLLKVYCPQSVPPSQQPKLLHTPQWDYPYRAYMSEELWAATMAAIARDLSYQNFKKWTARTSPRQAELAHDIWAAGYAYGQPPKKEEIHTCIECKLLPPHTMCWEDAHGMNRWS